jgi:hypothetical protein
VRRVCVVYGGGDDGHGEGWSTRAKKSTI